MALAFEDLQVLKTAETLADEIWLVVSRWGPLARDVVGKQLARAADSIGANIAEAFGRYHYQLPNY
jgi:four helix bundle protein